MPAPAGIAPQAVDQLLDLVDPPPGAERPFSGLLVRRPVDPLLAVDRPEIPPAQRERGILDDSRLKLLLRDVFAGRLAIFRQRPVAPDRHSLREQRADVGLAG